ncbi:unnamed protein product [Prunus armeniaca]
MTMLFSLHLLFVDTTLGLLSYTAIRHIPLGFEKWYKSIGVVAREQLVKEYRDPLGRRSAGYVKFFTYDPDDALEFLDEIAEKAHQWIVLSPVETIDRSRIATSSTNKGIYQLKEEDDWKLKYEAFFEQYSSSIYAGTAEAKSKLGLGELNPTTMKLQLADRSVDKWRPRFEKLPPRKEKTLPSNVEVPKLELKPTHMT